MIIIGVDSLWIVLSACGHACVLGCEASNGSLVNAAVKQFEAEPDVDQNKQPTRTNFLLIRIEKLLPDLRVGELKHKRDHGETRVFLRPDRDMVLVM